MPQDEITPDKILDYIRKYESGGRNVPNYMFSEQPDAEGKKHTAQGYYQITNENWNTYAPLAGVDTIQYPNAMAAPEDVQRKVASHILTQTPSGVKNWTDYNPKLQAALDQPALDKPEAKPVADNPYSDLSDEDLDKRIAELQGQVKAAQTPTKKERQPNWFEKTVVGPLGRWATTPEPDQPSFLRGGMVVPGAKQIARGVTGYGEDPGSRWRSGASDIMEGVGKELIPVGIGAALGLGGGALAGGEGLGGVASALSPLAKTGVGGAIGAGAAGVGTGLFTDDPETVRFAKDLGGYIGGWGGSKVSNEALLQMARYARSPAAQAGGMIALAHYLGLPPYVGEAAAVMRLGGSLRGGGSIGSRIGRMFGGPAEAPKPAPTTPVKPPTPPTRAESMEMLRTGNIDRNRFLEHEAQRGSDPQVALEHLATAESRIAEKQPTIQPTIQVANVGGTTSPQALQNLPQVNPPPSGAAPTSTNPIQPVQAVLPPGLTITTSGANLPPVKIPPGGPQTSTNPLVQAPVAAPTGIPAPGLGAVGPIRPAAPLPGPAPTATPLGLMPELAAKIEPEQRLDSIFRAAVKFERAPPVTSNKLALGRWIKELGFTPDKEELSLAKKRYADWKRSQSPSVTNP